MHNGKFWNGLRDQLPSYLQSDDASHGWYIAIQYRSNKSAFDRLKQLPAEIARLASHVGKTIRYTAVDARRPPSASNIRDSDQD